MKHIQRKLEKLEQNIPHFSVTGQKHVYRQCIKYTRQKDVIAEISSNFNNQTNKVIEPNWTESTAIKIKAFCDDIQSNFSKNASFYYAIYQAFIDQ